MSKQTQASAENAKQDHEGRMVLIGDHVLRELGHPIGLFRLQVRWLWGENYRVNVLIGQDIASATVAHSYFVAAESGSDILRVTPAIIKQYGPRAAVVASFDAELPGRSTATPA